LAEISRSGVTAVISRSAVIAVISRSGFILSNLSYVKIQNGGQNGGPKLLLSIKEPFIIGFG